MIRPAGFRRLHPIVPDRAAFAAAAEQENETPTRPMTTARRRNMVHPSLAPSDITVSRPALSSRHKQRFFQQKAL
jgi:hypothetical protein